MALTRRVQVEGEDDDLDVQDILVLEHFQLHLELLLQAWSRLRRSVSDAALKGLDQLVCALRERLHREERAAGAGKPEWTAGFPAG